MVTNWLLTGILVVHIPWDIMSKDVYPYDSLNINILEYNVRMTIKYLCSDNGDSYES